MRYIAKVEGICGMSQRSHEARRRLGDQIERNRDQRGWTLRELSKRVGRDPARLSEIESGRANPSIDNLLDLGEALGLEIVFVPRERLAEALGLAGDRASALPSVPTTPSSLLDEILIEGDDDPENDVGHAPR
ncbi:helix-turn-helix domain-containing protein [Bosea sp. 2KB_26]|uniref:helix-turn-helix domain-containing protein n=1 Tax=Bosea sp. 2KB_26 TaxID=3237475 RepID=UPI003F909B19